MIPLASHRTQRPLHLQSQVQAHSYSADMPEGSPYCQTRMDWLQEKDYEVLFYLCIDWSIIGTILFSKWGTSFASWKTWVYKGSIWSCLKTSKKERSAGSFTYEHIAVWISVPSKRALSSVEMVLKLGTSRLCLASLLTCCNITIWHVNHLDMWGWG